MPGHPLVGDLIQSARFMTKSRKYDAVQGEHADIAGGALSDSAYQKLKGYLSNQILPTLIPKSLSQP